MAASDAVEAADQTARGSRSAPRAACNSLSRARASSGGMRRSGSASSTENGPISVRLSDTAMAAERLRDRPHVGAEDTSRSGRRCRPRTPQPSSRTCIAGQASRRRRRGGEGVRALPPDLDCRRRRNRKVDGALRNAERARDQRHRRLVVVDPSPSRSPVDVLDHRGRRGQVPLVRPTNRGCKSCRCPRQEQECRRERRASPRAPCEPRAATGGSDDVERRRPRRLVHQDHPPRFEPTGRHSRAPRASRSGPRPLRTTNSVISSTERSLRGSRRPRDGLPAPTPTRRAQRTLVDRRAQRHLAAGAAVARRLADEREDGGALDRPKDVDDLLGVRQVADRLEVVAEEVRDDDLAASRHPRTPRARDASSFTLRELDVP